MRGGHQILPRYSAAVLWPRSTISILDMKRMFSKMDRSPTLEDRNSNVRFGSKAVMCGAQGHVCFTPESGHVRRNYGCPLWAKSGHDAGNSKARGLTALNFHRRTNNSVCLPQCSHSKVRSSAFSSECGQRFTKCASALQYWQTIGVM